MALMSTQQAADRIGVSVRHIQRMVTSGDLVAIGTDRIDVDSVAQWLAQRQGSRARAWEEATAWAAVALLEGEQAPWLGQAQRSRLRSTLTQLTADELAARTRNRARVLRYRAHPRAGGHLIRALVPSGVGEALGDLTAVAGRIDGYVARSKLLDLVIRYRMEIDPTGDLTLRETGMPMDIVEHLADGGRHVLAGLDLAGSTDTRERSTGRRLLEHELDRLRG
jgi:hypothetical protein